MKHFIFTLTIINLLLAVGSAHAQEGVEIGVSAPLTGESAVFGEDIRDVLTFARDYFKDAHINLDIQDDQCSGKAGASVAQYFVQREVRAVLGYACVESIMPAIPILATAKIPVISVLASGPEITGPGKGVFNLYPSDELGVAVLVQRLKELGIQELLVLTASSAFPVGITEAFKKQMHGSANLKATFVDYPAMTSDFRSILSKLGSEKSFQATFINYSSVSEFLAFMRQRDQLKQRSAVFTSYLNGFDAIKAESAVQLVNGVEFYDTAPIERTLRQDDKRVFDEYLRQRGHLKSSDGYFPFIFNGYVALRTALLQKGNLSQTLANTSVITGLGNPFHFDRNGNVQGGLPFVMKKIVDGELATCPCR